MTKLSITESFISFNIVRAPVGHLEGAGGPQAGHCGPQFGQHWINSN